MSRPASLLELLLLLLILPLNALSSALDRVSLESLPALPLGLWRRGLHESIASPPADTFGSQHTFSGPPKYPDQWLDTPVNHFPSKERYHPHVNDTFQARYWVDDSHYKPGGPIYVLFGGETSGSDRLAFLDTGILSILSEATNGMGVVLEHRYYGESQVTQNLSTTSMRFLSTEQSLADASYWVNHVKLDSLGGGHIDPSTTPVIFYGGSYAGGQAAFMRTLYPDIAYGAIASSGVIHAQLDSWQYFEPIRQNGPPACIEALMRTVSQIDHILINGTHKDKHALKSQFGLQGISSDADFTNILTEPLSNWQALTWQRSYARNPFYEMCETLGRYVDPMYGFAEYVRREIASTCKDPKEQDGCFGTFDVEQYQQDSLEEEWRLWTWQYCTEWGYFIGAPPSSHPSLVSRLLDVDYNARICNYAFNLTLPPNTTEINQWGSFGLEADRLALIDGSWDPWIFATAHSPAAPSRKDTERRPFYLIPGGVHHYDESGNRERESEPGYIQDVHEREVEFVKAWLRSSS